MSLSKLWAAGQPEVPSAELDDEMRRLVARHGPGAVREAAAIATKQRAGRKKIPDNPKLAPFFEGDLEDWLAGRDPFELRKNYGIARAYAEKYPGHDRVSTCKRIERKLKLFRPFVLYVRAERVTYAG